MTAKAFYVLHNAQQAHQVITNQLWPFAKAMLMAGQKLVVQVKGETRTLEQNARLWAMLADISEQVEWYGRKLDAENWKHIFSAALSKQDVVPNLDGTGFVVLGKSTSKMTKAEMCDLQTLIEAFGVQRGVKFKEVSYD